MPESSSTLWWTIAGVLVAAVIIGVVLAAFPDLTTSITNSMGDMIKTASDKITGSLTNVKGSTIILGSGLPFLE